MSDYFVHESSYIDEEVQIGDGSKIWHFCHLMPRSRIGRNCNIGQNVTIASDVAIGDNVKIQNNVSIYTGVLIEDDVFLGPSMVFTNVLNPRSHVPRKKEYRQTLVKKGASIGANATIVCGVNIGSYAFVGAGAVVTADVPDHALVYGSPARIHGWICECGIKLQWTVAENRISKLPAHDVRSVVSRLVAEFDYETALCLSCGAQYRKQGQIVRPMERVNVA